MFGPIIVERFIESDKLTFRQVFRFLSFICFVQQFRPFRVDFGEDGGGRQRMCCNWCAVYFQLTNFSLLFINNMRITILWENMALGGRTRRRTEIILYAVRVVRFWRGNGNAKKKKKIQKNMFFFRYQKPFAEVEQTISTIQQRFILN